MQSPLSPKKSRSILPTHAGSKSSPTQRRFPPLSIPPSFSLRTVSAIAILTTTAVILAYTLIFSLPRRPSVATTAAHGPYRMLRPPLRTQWTDQVGLNPWPSHPRPQLYRPSWQTLNGVWQFRPADSYVAVDSPPFGQTLGAEVLIPSCLESALSGIGEQHRYSWFRTTFNVSEALKASDFVLSFGAVDYEATIFLNGRRVGFHRGGYTRFSLDVTALIDRHQSNELLVFVHDPTDAEGTDIPLGKQRSGTDHIFYEPCSGIWQTVFLESVPASHITDLDLTADRYGNITGTIAVSGDGRPQPFTLYLHSPRDNSVLATVKGTTNSTFTLSYPDADLWSPSSPTLYNITVSLGLDQVYSYVGFRSIEKGVVQNISRPLLNGEYVFQFGTLDQGYWPDGLYTPPTHEAMVFDLLTLKKLGFNMVRKHLKVESDEWYHACDRLGLLVWQDFPAMRDTMKPNGGQLEDYNQQALEIVRTHKHFPSIVTWVTYNEGWGQIDHAPEYVLIARLKQIDSTRLFDGASGWLDHAAGDFHDNHHYSSPQCGTPFYSRPNSPFDPNRIGFQGEFGGVGHNVSAEHLWPNPASKATIDQAYEVVADLETWNYRTLKVFDELREQATLYSCSGGVWVQTTDVEGELNGIITYDRKILRPDVPRWNKAIEALYGTAQIDRGTT